MNKPMNIAVLFNKPTARFARHAAHWEAEEDTEDSSREVAAALASKGANVTVVPITEHTIESVVDTLSADMVFNLIEWTGVDLPFALATFDRMDARHLVYTGATKDNYALTCDKARMKQLFDDYHLPTPRWQLFTTGKEDIREDFYYPVIVKVSLEHSSVGLTHEAIVHDESALLEIVTKRLKQFAQPVYAEEFLSGREFQVTLIDTTQGLTVLPASEIVYTKETDVPFLTYESRWDMTHPDYNNSDVILAKLTPALSKDIETMSEKAFTSLGFRDYARFDIRCRAEDPLFLEVNSNPGLGDDPEYGMTVSYKAAGMHFADFIWEIVGATKRRTTV